MRSVIIICLMLLPTGGWCDTPPELPQVSLAEQFESQARQFEAIQTPQMQLEIDRVNKTIRYFEPTNKVTIELQLTPEGTFATKTFDRQGNLLRESIVDPATYVDSNWDPRIGNEEVKVALKALADACEWYATHHRGQYPTSVEQLIQAEPDGLKKNYCQKGTAEYRLDCHFGAEGYSVDAHSREGPTEPFRESYTVRTGGILDIRSKFHLTK